VLSVFIRWSCTRYSSVTDGGGAGAIRLPGKLNVKTGLPLADVLIFIVLLVFSKLLFFTFFGVFSFY